MTANNQGFPQIGLPLVDQAGHITQTWLQLLISLWQRTGGGTGGGFAPPDAPYLVETANPGVPNAFVIENTPTVTWDFSVPAEAKANVNQGALHINESQVNNLVADLAERVTTATTITTDSGLTGGGALTTDLVIGIGNNGVTNALLAQMPAATIKGNNLGSPGNALDLTPAQVSALLNLFTSLAPGLVPASGGGTTNYLRADATFDNPLAGGATGTVSLAKLTGGGTPGSLTVVNGLITSIVNPT